MSDLVKRLRKSISNAYNNEAADEIERLTKERDAFQDQCIRLKNERAVEREELAAVTRERDEADFKMQHWQDSYEQCQKDAERYQFIRQVALSDDDTQEHHKQVMENAIPEGEALLTEELWDAAIDAAIAAMKEQRT